MARHEKVGRLSAQELARIAAYKNEPWLRKLGKTVVGGRPNKVERRIAQRQDMTLFAHVYDSASKMLEYSGEIDELLHLHEIAEDITHEELDQIASLFFPREPVIAASSLAFDDPVHVNTIYGLLRASNDEPMVGMDRYRYITVFHGEPAPYGLPDELFVVGLVGHEKTQVNQVLGKASLEPVFMDTLDAFGALENFAPKQQLARIVQADLAATVETYVALNQSFVH